MNSLVKTMKMDRLLNGALLFLVFSFVTVRVNSAHVEIPPPTAVAYLINNEYENTNFFTKEGKQGLDQNKIVLNDIVNTDIEVDPGRSVQLECKATEPIQWNYRGPGKPEFATTVEVDDEDNQEIYKASLFIPSANEKDTGLYACSYAEFPKVYSSYHLFVAGPEIFVPHSGKAITYKTGTDYVIVPCPVTVKSARVTLRKVFFDDTLRNIEPPLATFDPKFGFKISIKDFRDAEGVYICTGYYKGNLRVLEFSLRSEEHNETAVKFPDNEDLNPCLSYSCPPRSICRVNPNTHLPFCACRPKTGFSAQTNCTRLCKSSHDCPKSEKCQFSLEKQLKMCVHACDDHKCGENAECYVDEQRGIPKCRCRRGYQGNPNFLCDRIPILKQDVSGNSYCTNTKCGPNAKCQNIDGRIQCACFAAVGQWPNCERVCTSDIDCDRQDRCDNQHGVCVPVCSEGMCAPKADCKVIHRQPMCLCPPGYTGKATEACYPSHFYYSGTSSRSGFSLEDIDVTFETDPTTDATTSISSDSQLTFEDDSKRNVTSRENDSLKIDMPDSGAEES